MTLYKMYVCLSPAGIYRFCFFSGIIIYTFSFFVSFATKYHERVGIQNVYDLSYRNGNLAYIEVAENRRDNQE